jgi:hypothetical protein
MKTKSNIYIIFADWLKENKAQLMVSLIPAPDKNGKIYYFKRIPENLISLQINDGGIGIWVFYEGVAVEMLLDLDAVSGYKRGHGYYCRLCIEPAYYSSLKEFYIQHCFERLLIWLNTKLAKSEFIDICFFGDRDGISCAYLSADTKQKKRYIKKLKSEFSVKSNIVVEEIKVNLWVNYKDRNLLPVFKI